MSVEARDPEDEVFAWPHLLFRELLVALGVVILLHVVSLVFMAPLEEMADPTRTPNPAKAPWYFLGLQELVHYSALVGGVLVPTPWSWRRSALPYVDAHPRRGPLVRARAARRQRDLHALVVVIVRRSDDHRHVVPRPELGLGVAVVS